MRSKGLSDDTAERSRFSVFCTALKPEWQAKVEKARCEGFDSTYPAGVESQYQKKIFSAAKQIYDIKNGIEIRIHERKREEAEAKSSKMKRLTIVESSDSEEEEVTEAKTPKKIGLTRVEARILEVQAKSQEKDPDSEQALAELHEVGTSMMNMANVLTQVQSHFDKVSKLLVKERKARKKLSKETKALNEQLEKASESLEEQRRRGLRLLQENKRLRDEVSRRSDKDSESLRDQSKENKRLKRANEQLKRNLRIAMDLNEESRKKPKTVDNTTLDVQTALDQARLAAQEQESTTSNVKQEKDQAMDGLWF